MFNLRTRVSRQIGVVYFIKAGSPRGDCMWLGLGLIKLLTTVKGFLEEFLICVGCEGGN